MTRYVVSVYVGHDASLAIVGDDGRIVHYEFERFIRERHAAGDQIKQYYGQALAQLGITDADVVAAVGLSGSLGHDPGAWGDYNQIVDAQVCTEFGTAKPLYIVPHHTAHLAYAAYTSPYESVRLVAQDGGGDNFGFPFLHATHPYTCSVDCAVGELHQGFGAAGTFNAEWIAARFIGGAWQVACTAILGRPYTEGTLMAALGIPRDQAESIAGIAGYQHDELRRLQEITNRTFHHLVPHQNEPGPVALAGGCALNGIAMYQLLKRDDVSAIHVPPSVHDGGLTIGGAMLVLHKVLGVPRVKYSRDAVAFCGFTEPALDGVPDAARIAEDIAAGRIVAVAHGNAESGPRALGHRSLLADPRTLRSKDRLNVIKGREPWRPVAPVVLRECADTYFDVVNDRCYDYMTTIAPAWPGTAERIPAAVHVDGSARVQVVDATDQPLGAVVAAFHALTGCPVVLNTSMNGRGDPICNSAADARSFFASAADVDVLYVGSERVTR